MKDIQVVITVCGPEGDPDDWYVDILTVPYNASEKEVWDAARARYGQRLYDVCGYPQIVSM